MGNRENTVGTPVPPRNFGGHGPALSLMDGDKELHLFDFANGRAASVVRRPAWSGWEVLAGTHIRGHSFVPEPGREPVSGLTGPEVGSLLDNEAARGSRRPQIVLQPARDPGHRLLSYRVAGDLVRALNPRTQGLPRWLSAETVLSHAASRLPAGEAWALVSATEDIPLALEELDAAPRGFREFPHVLLHAVRPEEDQAEAFRTCEDYVQAFFRGRPSKDSWGKESICWVFTVGVADPALSVAVRLAARAHNLDFLAVSSELGYGPDGGGLHVACDCGGVHGVTGEQGMSPGAATTSLVEYLASHHAGGRPFLLFPSSWIAGTKGSLSRILQQSAGQMEDACWLPPERGVRGILPPAKSGTLSVPRRPIAAQVD